MRLLTILWARLSEMTTEQIQEQQLSNPVTAVPGRPFAKGQSGNPKGRPRKGETLMDVLALRVGKRKVQIARGLVAKAEKGDVRAFVAIRDTLFGVPKQTLAIEDEQSGYQQLLAALTGLDGLDTVSTSLPDPQNSSTDSVEASYKVLESPPASPNSGV